MVEEEMMDRAITIIVTDMKGAKVKVSWYSVSGSMVSL